MSTVITKNLQIGADGTASNNFTIYQPASPDGTLRIGNGNTGTTSAQVVLTSAGNVGIGQTPTAYGATVRNVEAYIAGASGFTLVSASSASVKTEITASEGSLLGQVGTRTNHPLVLKTNDTERMRIDSAGNVGIGTSSPNMNTSGTVLHINNSTASRAAIAHFTTAASGSGPADGLIVGKWSDDTNYIFDYDSNPIVFGINSGEAMRIDTNRNLLVGTTSAFATTATGVQVQSNDWASQFYTTANSGAGLCLSARRNNNGVVAGFLFNGSTFTSAVGNISITASATQYITSSDYRLKHDIQPMTGALAKVAALKPVTYKWNVDDSEGQGFIAHELQEVVPQCVTGEKDAVDAEGNPQYQGIDTSFLVATLTAAIQELKAELDTVKAELQTLKGSE